MSVRDWFQTFCTNIRMMDSTVSSISQRYHTITRRINLDYYDSDSNTAHSFYVGSYGRGTEIYSSDIDMLVQLPYETYSKFRMYCSNGQSALLQEVKEVLKKTYSTTKLKGDGQIISIPFSDGVTFEVLPAFLNKDNNYTFPNSNQGGSWKTTDPKSEIDAINRMNENSNKNLKRLCRMTRAWKNKNSVSISGILIDILAYKFISDWEYRDKSYLYYDYMSRDFFKYLSERDETQKLWKVMGSGRYIAHIGSFTKKALTAHNTALEAISNENHYPYISKFKWREIYGSKFSA